MKQILFFIIYRYHFKIYKIPTVGLNNLYATVKIEHLKFLYNRFKNKFSFIRNRMVKYYNIKRIKRLSFEEENKVYLFRKNIIIKRPNDKLDFKKFGSFIIAYKFSEYNYKLSLFKTI